MINGSAHGQQTSELISNWKLSPNVVVDIAEHPVEPGWHISNLINNTVVSIVNCGIWRQRMRVVAIIDMAP